MKLKRIISRLIHVLGIIVASLIILIMMGFGLLQTGAAKRRVARELTELLGKELGAGSSVSGISGFIPFNIKVEEIKLSDQHGDWLRIDDFSFRFSPSQLFRLRVRIDELSAGLVDLKRLPQSKETPAEKKNKPEGGGGLPRDLPKLELTRLSIRRLILGEELAGERTTLNLDGSVNFNPDSESVASLKITGTESPIFSAGIEGRASLGLERLNLNIRVADEAGGILSRLIGLPEAGPILLLIRGEGPTDRLHTDLEIDIKKVGSINGLINLNFKQPGADGEITITIDKLDPLSQLIEDPITGSFQANIRLNLEDGGQNGSIEAKITDFSMGSIKAAETDLSINLKDIVNSPSGEISISIVNLNYTEGEANSGIETNTAGLHILFSGPPAQPDVNLKLQVEGITFPSFLLNNSDTVKFSVEAHLKDDRISSKIDLSGSSDIQLQGNADGSAKLTLSPFSFDLPSDEEMEAKLNGRIDLGLLAALGELSRQSLTGSLIVDFSTVGTIQKPEYRGSIKMENGEYQNLDSGTVLTDLQLDVEADHSRVVIRQFEASDPHEGKLAIDGSIALAPEKNYPFSSSLTLTSMELANTDDYWAVLSGKIIVSGDMEAMNVEGGVDIDSAGFRIPKTSSPSVVGIPVIEINKPGDHNAPAPAEPSPFLKNIDLGLTIKAVDQISVSGRGLSSTWGADLSIGGTAAAPVIKGGLKLSDGYFLFLGKRLELTDCSISLTGGVPISPQININAQVTSGEIGRASSRERVYISVVAVSLKEKQKDTTLTTP